MSTGLHTAPALPARPRREGFRSHTPVAPSSTLPAGYARRVERVFGAVAEPTAEDLRPGSETLFRLRVHAAVVERLLAEDGLHHGADGERVRAAVIGRLCAERIAAARTRS